jgi:hypothetical protein
MVPYVLLQLYSIHTCSVQQLGLRCQAEGYR